MAIFSKFTCFKTDLGLGLHNLNTDTLSAYLSNDAPAAGDTVYNGGATGPVDLTTKNGYTAGGMDITNVWAAGALTSADTIVWTGDADEDALGIGPFRYAVLYNSTAAAKNLIGWWDYGSTVTVMAGETFTVDYGASVLTIT